MRTGTGSGRLRGEGPGTWLGLAGTSGAGSPVNNTRLPAPAIYGPRWASAPPLCPAWPNPSCRPGIARCPQVVSVVKCSVFVLRCPLSVCGLTAVKPHVPGHMSAGGRGSFEDAGLRAQHWGPLPAPSPHCPQAIVHFTSRDMGLRSPCATCLLRPNPHVTSTVPWHYSKSCTPRPHSPFCDISNYFVHSSVLLLNSRASMGFDLFLFPQHPAWGWGQSRCLVGISPKDCISESMTEWRFAPGDGTVVDAVDPPTGFLGPWP